MGFKRTYNVSEAQAHQVYEEFGDRGYHTVETMGEVIVDDKTGHGVIRIEEGIATVLNEEADKILKEILGLKKTK